mgnify:CR=1 FL=1
MQLLLADSGGTKTNWVLLRPALAEPPQLQTRGLNPHITAENTAQEVLRDEVRPFLQEHWQAGESLVVTFYGAGCSSPAQRQRVYRWLQQALFAPPELPTAIAVHHDLLGAARACFGRQKGVVGILGTGSSSAEYDGTAILREAGQHGYLLQDYGSGRHIGGRILEEALEHRLPEPLRDHFLEFTGEPLLNLRDRLFLAERPSYELARLAAWPAEFQKVRGHLPQALEAIVKECFQTYVERVLALNYSTSLPVAFIGGVAGNYARQLAEITEAAGYAIRHIRQDPLPQLIAFHQQQLAHDA